MKKRRTEITIETRSMTIIRIRNSHAAAIECRQCGQPVPTFSEANAALVFGVDARQLDTNAMSGVIHYAANTELCGNSLAAYFKQEIRYIED